MCLGGAKGQKHFKERPDHWSDEGHIQPIDVTLELIERYLGSPENPYVNIKYCCKCPRCGGINQKRGRRNLLTCEQCEMPFCYICNKPIDGIDHYDGQATCHLDSDPWNDL